MLQVSDTAFPTGSFSHSMAVEAFAEAGELQHAEDLKRVAGLHLSTMATSDCVALRAAFGAELEELFRIDRLLTATRLTRELRAASSSTGRRFLLSVAALGVEGAVLGAFTDAARNSETPGNLAVGYGVAAPALGLTLDETLRAYLYSTAASLVAAGQKLIPLGGSAAQRVLYELGDKIEIAAKTSETMEVEEMYAFAPTIDVRSMMHERQRTRLYIS
ncbi:MAG TPA: urease accessory UreF family protein [Rubrobacteraceae bacterium]|nr:urease accessory UreF family protein [Rubrobacteraceae bacterium]